MKQILLCVALYLSMVACTSSEQKVNAMEASPLDAKVIELVVYKVKPDISQY